MKAFEDGYDDAFLLIEHWLGQRIREAKSLEHQAARQPESQRENDTGDPSLYPDTVAIVQHDLLDVVDLTASGDKILGSLPPNTQAPSNRPHEFVPNLGYEVPIQLTLSGALFINGQILGLPCCLLIPARSAPATPDIPLPLRPTAIQLTTIHTTSIDRFPFPRFRDKYINMNSLFDEEELTRDLLLAPSLTITPGCVPWDPRAWKMSRAFADKWSFLFQ